MFVTRRLREPPRTFLEFSEGMRTNAHENTHTFFEYPLGNPLSQFLCGRIGKIEKVDFWSTIIRRDALKYFPYRQSNRACSFVLFLCSFWGRFIRGSRAGKSQLKAASWPARRSEGIYIELLAVLKHTYSSRFFREQSVRLAYGESSSASPPRLWCWTSSRVAKESTAAAAAVLRKGHR